MVMLKHPKSATQPHSLSFCLNPFKILIHQGFLNIILNQYWQTSGPKFGPTRYPADRSIHWAGIGLGILSPGPNRTQFGRTDMYAKCGSGKQFFRSIGSVFACGKPGKTSVEPLMKWDYPTRHFLSSTVPKSL